MSEKSPFKETRIASCSWAWEITTLCDESVDIYSLKRNTS